MKIGWLLYEVGYDFNETVEFFTVKPEYYSGRLVQIAYAEIIDAN